MKSYWKAALPIAALCVALTGVAGAARAADPAGEAGSAAVASFPAKTVHVIVGFSPGGLPDLAARLIAPALTDLWKQQVIVENRPGAGSTVAARQVANASPDGYTLLSATAAHAAASALYAKLSYDPAQDFAGVVALGSTPMLLVAAPSLGIASVRDLIAAAKARPRQLNYSSAGVGSNTHFAMEVFDGAAGLDIVHVAYKGIPEALTETMTGRVQLFMAPLGNAVNQVKQGKLVALGVTSAQRSKLLPDVPTIEESGVSYRWTAWFGLLAPAKTPRPIIEKLHADISGVLGQPAVQARLAALGTQAMPGTPEQFDQTIRDDIEVFTKAARAAGIKPM